MKSTSTQIKIGSSVVAVAKDSSTTTGSAMIAESMWKFGHLYPTGCFSPFQENYKAWFGILNGSCPAAAVEPLADFLATRAFVPTTRRDLLISLFKPEDQKKAQVVWTALQNKKPSLTYLSEPLPSLTSDQLETLSSAGLLKKTDGKYYLRTFSLDFNKSYVCDKLHLPGLQREIRRFLSEQTHRISTEDVWIFNKDSNRFSKSEIKVNPRRAIVSIGRMAEDSPLQSLIVKFDEDDSDVKELFDNCKFHALRRSLMELRNPPFPASVTDPELRKAAQEVLREARSWPDITEYDDDAVLVVYAMFCDLMVEQVMSFLIKHRSSKVKTVFEVILNPTLASEESPHGAYVSVRSSLGYLDELIDHHVKSSLSGPRSVKCANGLRSRKIDGVEYYIVGDHEPFICEDTLPGLFAAQRLFVVESS